MTSHGFPTSRPLRPRNIPASLNRNTASIASTLARFDDREPADAGTSSRTRRGEDGVGVGALGVVATAISDVADDAVGVLFTDKVRWDEGDGV